MKIHSVMILSVIFLSFLLGLVDMLEFPDGISLALSIVQLAALVLLLEKLDSENNKPGS